MATKVRTAVFGLVLLASGVATAEPAPPSDLAGTYACEGANPDGSAYTAVVQIVKLADTYLVRWVQEDGDDVVGIGIHRDGVLAVSYFGGTPVIVVYSVGADGTLGGTWTMGGREGSVFEEILTKLAADQQPPPTRRPRPAPRRALHPNAASV
jgi:hypothetical protein